MEIVGDALKFLTTGSKCGMSRNVGWFKTWPELLRAHWRCGGGEIAAYNAILEAHKSLKCYIYSEIGDSEVTQITQTLRI